MLVNNYYIVYMSTSYAITVISIKSVDSIIIYHNMAPNMCVSINKKDILFLETNGGSGLLLGSGFMVSSP